MQLITMKWDWDSWLNLLTWTCNYKLQVVYSVNHKKYEVWKCRGWNEANCFDEIEVLKWRCGYFVFLCQKEDEEVLTQKIENYQSNEGQNY